MLFRNEATSKEGPTISNEIVHIYLQFYPGKEVKFLTARTVSNDGTIEVEPEYFLFYGLN